MTTIFVLGAIAIAGTLYALVPVMLEAYWKLRGTRLVSCPENHEPATVALDTSYAAFTAALGTATLRLRDCSRWPDRHDCTQACLSQIELVPEE